jgi:hypothetical protein
VGDPSGIAGGIVSGPTPNAEGDNGGSLTLKGGDGWTSEGGNVFIQGGNPDGGDRDGGRIDLTPGAASGTGIPGQILMRSLPTSDPLIEGAIWNNGGTLKISAG